MDATIQAKLKQVAKNEVYAMIKRFYTSGHKIQRVTFTEDDYGGVVETWADHLTVSGKLWQLSGDKKLSADKETIFSTHKFATDIADIVGTDRYLDPDGNAYEIKAVSERQRQDGTGHIELDLELVT